MSQEAHRVGDMQAMQFTIEAHGSTQEPLVRT